MWNFADVWDAIAALQPDRDAIVQGETRVSWGTFSAHADALAADLLDAGLERQAKVGILLRNSPEYLIAVYAAYKAGLVPFNINYRYGSQELAYLFDNSDAAAIVFHSEFASVLETVRAGGARVRHWVEVEQTGVATSSWAIPYLQVVARGRTDSAVSPRRSGDDLMLLYTGGTTGMPKGVMWRQDDAFRANGGGGDFVSGVPPMESLEQGLARLAARSHRPVRLICPPLMHGAGQSPSQGTLSAGGTVVLLTARGFDPNEALAAAERHKVDAINIVGSAFGVPLVEALEGDGARRDLSSVKAIFSSGAMLDVETRRALLSHCRNAVIVDKLGASEISSLAEAVTRPGAELATARFTPTRGFALISDDGEVLDPVPGARGRLASSHLVPSGYYKDPAKTAETFLEIGGVRYGVPGDYAEIAADGTIRFLGRQSQCINTGGEKVFAEEVEEALKTHPAVRDAAVVGLPDQRFGAVVHAFVAPATTAKALSFDELAAHVRTRLAAYKVPRDATVVEEIVRLANGKVDYAAMRSLAVADAPRAPEASHI